MTVVVNVKGTSGAGSPTSGSARGVVFIHSCARAVSAHVEWALARVFGTEVHIDWADQPIAPGMVRAELILERSGGHRRPHRERAPRLPAGPP